MGILKFIAGDLNDFIWGWFGIAMLLGTGILMTILSKFFQVRHFGHWMKMTIGRLFDKKVTGHTDKKESISQFQALCTALAATVGTGNIAGVAGAIALGGPGAVFWMWLSAFFGMMTNFSENVLGIYYRRKDKNGEWAGGAMYYLQDGLGGKKNCKAIGQVLAVLFAVFAVLASFGIGNLAQANTISGNLYAAFGLPRWVTGAVLLVVAGLVVIGGIKRIARVTEKIVPVMSVIYIAGALVILFMNITKVGDIFASIFRFAFTPAAVGGGAVGVAIKMGFKRGIFSNEAGLGSSVMVHSASNVKEPVRQGLWGIFEVFFDTIIICTLTAIVVLSSGVIDLTTGGVLAQFADMDKNTLVAQAFTNCFGTFGGMFVAIAVLFFAFSTVLGWSYYGTRSWIYLFGEKSAIIYKTIFVAIVFVSSVLTDVALPWDISDTFNGLMMVPNLIGVLMLSPLVIKITQNYVDRKLKGKEVTPMYSAFEDIQAAEMAAPEDA
ncbi:MAG: alanine/glycine:cation symporter family protein [Clostridia bacterium]|nr:alanine/glycine:cation symporter family protein [Clostridia bacterium]